jgi:hypothetical protein
MLPETSILAYVADLDDPRTEGNRKHPFVTIAILGVICGAETWGTSNATGTPKRL